jgi:hypothetical protein
MAVGALIRQDHRRAGGAGATQAARYRPAVTSRLLGKGVGRTNALEALVLSGFVRGLSVPEGERLLEELRRTAGRYDPPPASVVEAARGSLSWRTIDAELAALAFDSAVDQPVSAIRGADGPRQLAFDAPGLSIEVEVSPAGTAVG